MASKNLKKLRSISRLRGFHSKNFYKEIFITLMINREKWTAILTLSYTAKQQSTLSIDW